ncbi:peptidase U35 phage prohead HK97, partial [Natrialba taiwanensis DSM 12281]
MTDHDDVAQRAYHQPDPDRVVVRDLDESEDGMFAIRMPISSTLEARDGDAFDEERLRGWETQINEGTVGVFLDHGMNTDLSMSRYSGTGKLGYYADAEVEQRDDDEFELVADTRIMDPDTLPESTGTLREHLSRIKAQAERDIPIAQSVGWADDTGGRDVPGDSDLLEGSIVGVPSDPEASSHSTGEALARAAVSGRPDADPERLVE